MAPSTILSLAAFQCTPLSLFDYVLVSTSHVNSRDLDLLSHSCYNVSVLQCRHYNTSVRIERFCLGKKIEVSSCITVVDTLIVKSIVCM